MAYSYVFANVTELDTPSMDVVYNEAGLLGTIPCDVSGTNTLTLTTRATGTPPFALQTYLRVSGVSFNSNTGPVTANVNAGGALNVYKDSSSGPVVLSGGEIIAGNYFVLAYDQVLGSGAGGWHLENGLVAGAPSGTAGGDLSGTYPNPTVAQINGVPLGTVTASSGGILVGSGAAWVKQAVTGDATLAASGALTVTKSNGTVFGPYATAALGQLPGTTTNDNAASGDIGQYISQNIGSGSAISMASASPYTIASISLTAGDWDVSGIVHFSAPGTSGTNWIVGISPVSGTLPVALSDVVGGTDGPFTVINISGGSQSAEQLATGVGRISLSGTTTIYLVAQITYTGSTPAGYGFIRARRVR